jgi:hypothetical protein
MPRVLVSVLQVIKQSSDLVLSKVTVQEPPMINKPTTVYQALRRRSGDDCCYIEWEFTTLAAGPMGVGYPTLQVTIRGQGRLQPATLCCGSVGSVFHEVSTTTLTVVDPSTVTAAASPSPNAHREIAILTRVFASLYQQKHASMRQAVENLLLDATLTARATRPLSPGGHH